VVPGWVVEENHILLSGEVARDYLQCEKDMQGNTLWDREHLTLCTTEIVESCHGEHTTT
jgi:hypothetical protein